MDSSEDALRLSLALLGVAALVIQSEHVAARRGLGLPTSTGARLLVCVAALGTVVAPTWPTAAAAGATLSCGLAILYHNAPEGLDTADAELWVFVTLCALGAASPSAASAAVKAIIASLSFVYLFASLNKIRSSVWRNGLAFSHILAGSDSALSSWVRSWRPLVAQAAAWSVIVVQLGAVVTVAGGDARRAWYIVAMMFQAFVAFGLGIPSFFVVGCAVAPVMLRT